MSLFIKFYFTSSTLNMFRTLIHPSSGACDFSIVSTHRVARSCYDVCWSFGVAGLGWYPCGRLKPINNTEVSFVFQQFCYTEDYLKRGILLNIRNSVRRTFYVTDGNRDLEIILYLPAKFQICQQQSNLHVIFRH